MTLYGLKHVKEDPTIKTIHELLSRSGALKQVPKNESRFTQQTHNAVTYFQQTHLDKKGKPLGVDGTVGPSTMWALKHNKGKAQKSNIKASIPKGITGHRRKVLEIALAEHAKPSIEKPNGSNRGPVVDNYLTSWWKKNAKGPPWCCLFYSWVTKEALGEFALGKREAACFQARASAKKKHLWLPSDAAPVPGDAFVMLYKKGGKFTGKGHIGFVLRVSKDGKKINTVEGNCGNRVKVGTRDVSTIEGFILPGQDTEMVTFTRGLNKAANVGSQTTR